MTALICLMAVIIITCVLLNNASLKIGMPVLLAFILLGIVFGNNGLFPVHFEDYSFAENICTVALIFIMFYGGFGTRWESARCVALPAGLLASFGVFLTAGLTGLFCPFALGWGWVESLLMGSVVSSTDAASVFSILRSRKLGLKNNSAPMLEIESGSNDPCSYMLTIIMLSIMTGGGTSVGKVAWMLFSQLAFGAGFGILIAKAGIWALKRIKFPTSGFDSLFILAIALLSYSIPSLVGGNGYLSAYLVGIMLGNANFHGKRNLVSFFDGVTGLMQVLIFFMLGMLARPAMMHKVILPALGIFLFMLLVARPVAVSAILAPFRKYGFKQQALISFVGLRGAASIVFAIFATVDNDVLQNDILNVVFCIVLLSISLQGFLLPLVAKKLGQLDDDADVMKTFNDFSEETDLYFSKIMISEDNPWKGACIKDMGLPRDILFCMLVRPDGTSVVPRGNTVLHEGDSVIMCTKAFRSDASFRLVEQEVSKSSHLAGMTIKEYSESGHNQVVLIKRGGASIIPNGRTVLCEGDVMFLNMGR